MEGVEEVYEIKEDFFNPDPEKQTLQLISKDEDDQFELVLMDK
jgi:hypothetical protein